MGKFSIFEDADVIKKFGELSNGMPEAFVRAVTAPESVSSFITDVTKAASENPNITIAEINALASDWQRNLADRIDATGDAATASLIRRNGFLEITERAAQQDIAASRINDLLDGGKEITPDGIDDILQQFPHIDLPADQIHHTTTRLLDQIDEAVQQRESVINSHATWLKENGDPSKPNAYFRERALDDYTHSMGQKTDADLQREAAEQARVAEEASTGAWAKVQSNWAYKAVTYLPNKYYDYTWQPVVKALTDTARVTKNIFTDYGVRAVSSRRTDHVFTKALFANTDTLKSTNAAGLSVKINPKNAVGTTFTYKKGGAQKSSENLTGSVDDSTKSLENVRDEIVTASANLKLVLTNASDEIKQAADTLEVAKSVKRNVFEFNQQSSIYQSRAADILNRSANPKAPLDTEMLKSELTSQLARETNGVNQAFLRNAINDVQNIENTADLTSADSFARASTIYNDLSRSYAGRAQDASDDLQTAADQAQNIIIRNKNLIENSGLDAEALKSFQDATDVLEYNIEIVTKSLDDIDTVPPPVNIDFSKLPEDDPRRRLTGGSVTARLASFEARPHLDVISEFANDVTRVTEQVTEQLDTSAITTAIGQVDKTSSTFVDDLRAIADRLDEVSAHLDGEVVQTLDQAIMKSKAAETAVSDMDNAVLKYTEVTENKNMDLFANSVDKGDLGINTGLATEFAAGRIELDVTNEMQKRFLELYNSNQLDMVLPNDVSIQRVLDYKPGETVMDVSASNQIYAKTPDQKFLEHAIMSHDLDKLEEVRIRATTMLESGDANRLWETMAWAMLTYARDPKTYKATSGRADDFHGQLIKTFEDVAKGRAGSDRWAGAFTDEIEKKARHIVKQTADLGANQVRKQWTSAWNRTRHLRYSGDRSSEMAYSPKKPKAGASADEIAVYEQELSEKAFAKWWTRGWHSEGQRGSGLLRTPGAIIGGTIRYLPYRATHLDSWSGLGDTVASNLPRWGLQSATIAGVSHLLFSGDADASQQPQPGGTLPPTTLPPGGSPPTAVPQSTSNQSSWGSSITPTFANNNLDDIREASEENLEKILNRETDQGGLISSTWASIPWVGGTDPSNLYIGNSFDKHRQAVQDYTAHILTKINDDIRFKGQLGLSDEHVEDLKKIKDLIPGQMDLILKSELSSEEKDLLDKAGFDSIEEKDRMLLLTAALNDEQRDFLKNIDPANITAAESKSIEKLRFADRVPGFDINRDQGVLNKSQFHTLSSTEQQSLSNIHIGILTSIENSLLTGAHKSRVEIAGLNTSIQAASSVDVASNLLLKQTAELTAFEKTHAERQNEVTQLINNMQVNGITPGSMPATSLEKDLIAADLINFAISLSDTNKDGTATDDEITNAIKRYRDAESSISQDVDNNGVVTFGELDAAASKIKESIELASKTQADSIAAEIKAAADKIALDRQKIIDDAKANGVELNTPEEIAAYVTQKETEAAEAEAERIRKAAEADALRVADETKRKAAELAAKDTDGDSKVSPAEEAAYAQKNAAYLDSIANAEKIVTGATAIYMDIGDFNDMRKYFTDNTNENGWPQAIDQMRTHVEHDDPNKTPEQRRKALEILANMDAEVQQTVALMNQDAATMQEILERVGYPDPDTGVRHPGLLDELRDLKTKTDDVSTQRVKEITEELKSLGTQAEAIRARSEVRFEEQMETIKRNEEYKYLTGFGGKKFNDLLLKIDGGQPGIMSGIFGTGGSGITSAAGGWLGMAKNRFGAFTEWWGDVKRGATSKGEATAYTAMELGLYGMLGLMAGNQLEKMGLPSWVKWAGFVAGGIALMAQSGRMMNGMGANSSMYNVAQSRAPNLGLGANASTSSSFNSSSNNSTENRTEIIAANHTPTTGVDISKINIDNRTDDEVQSGQITQRALEETTIQGSDNVLAFSKTNNSVFGYDECTVATGTNFCPDNISTANIGRMETLPANDGTYLVAASQ